MTRFDDNTAPWLVDALPSPPAPPLARDTDADVAIIGGGFTGVSTALHLSRRFPERRIVLLEAKRLANGASGRNGGMMLNGISFSDDDEVIAREYALTNGTIDAIEALIRDHGLRVRYRRDGCAHLSTSQAAADANQRYVERAGLPLRWAPDALRVHGAFGAIVDPGEGMINGVDLIRGMRTLLGDRVEIFEDTVVTQIREGDTIALAANGHTVRAKALVLATSAFTPQLGYFTTGILPVISHVIATDPLPREVLARIGLDRLAGFFDDLPRLAYCSVDTDGRLVFGGGATKAYAYQFGNQTAFTAARGDSGELATRAVLLRYLPELAAFPIRHRWSGPLDLALKRFVAMGMLGTNIYYAVGYSGHGITLANLAGRVLADLYSGVHEPWRDYAFYMQRPKGIPPEPFRWIGYQLVSRITGKSPFKRIT